VNKYRIEHADEEPPLSMSDRARLRELDSDHPGHRPLSLVRGTRGDGAAQGSRETVDGCRPSLRAISLTPAPRRAQARAGRLPALAEQMTGLPEQLRRSLTSDRGKELAQHTELKIDTGIDVYFADPHSPSQRGTNENTNGLLRQYFPKGTDLSRWSAQEIQAVAATLNSRPRKTLDWKTPAEALDDRLSSLQRAGVASTG
jgi:hypothetical protein